MHENPPEATALFHTERNPELESWGGEVGAWAKDRLGVTFMPWQQDFADVALEHVDGIPVHNVAAVLSVCRQSGKTVLTKAIVGWWLEKWEDQFCVFVAQNRAAAARRIIGLGEEMQRAGSDLRIYRGVPEHLIMGNGSELHIAAPNAEAIHGDSVDLGVVDEGWVSLSAGLMQGLIPARSARPASMMVVISTQGTEESHQWNALVEQGRRDDDGVCFVEYAMDTERHDLYADDDWAEWMPALNITTTKRTVWAGLNLLDPAEARRAYGNVMSATMFDLFDLTQWRSLEDVFEEPRKGDLVLGLSASDSTPRGASVVACWKRDDGRWHTELVEHRPGGGVLWVVETIEEMIIKFKPKAITIGGTSAIYAVKADVESAAQDYAVPFKRLPAAEDAAASAMFSEALRLGTITHGQSEALDLAVQYAIPKNEGDGGWRLDGKRMKVDGSPLSASMAALAMAIQEDDHGKPPGIF